MPPTPTELREQSHIFREAARKAATPDLKRRLARYALSLALAAEAVERGGQVPDDMLAELGDQERLIAEALNDGAPVPPSRPSGRKTAPGMPSQITAWRRRAEELRATADSFEVPSAQESLRRAAGNYDQLADQAEALLHGLPPVTDEKAG
jgi:hypothetical protein